MHKLIKLYSLVNGFVSITSGARSIDVLLHLKLRPIILALNDKTVFCLHATIYFHRAALLLFVFSNSYFTLKL